LIIGIFEMLSQIVKFPLCVKRSNLKKQAWIKLAYKKALSSAERWC